MIFKNNGNTDISGTAIIKIGNSTDVIQEFEYTFSDLQQFKTIEFTDEWESTEDTTIKIVGYVMYEGETTPPVIVYINSTLPEPSPTPTPEPSPSPSPEPHAREDVTPASEEKGNQGIPGFPYEAIILGIIAGAIVLWMMQRRN
jgi:hypothetical protein